MPFTIMVLEDDSSHRHAMEVHLASLGYAVIPVANGMTALREVEKQVVHLLVADMYLPGGPHGFAVANMIRNRFGVPAIFMTAFREMVDASNYPLPGRVFEKPIDLAELSAEIARMLAHSAPAVALSDTREQIRRWRMKAEELRTAAEDFTDAAARQYMMISAQTYDTLADGAEMRLDRRHDAKPEAG